MEDFYGLWEEYQSTKNQVYDGEAGPSDLEALRDELVKFYPEILEEGTGRKDSERFEGTEFSVEEFRYKPDGSEIPLFLRRDDVDGKNYDRVVGIDNSGAPFAFAYFATRDVQNISWIDASSRRHEGFEEIKSIVLDQLPGDEEVLIIDDFDKTGQTRGMVVNWVEDNLADVAAVDYVAAHEELDSHTRMGPNARYTDNPPGPFESII